MKLNVKLIVKKKSLIIGQMKRTLRLSKAKFHTENLTIIKKTLKTKVQ